LTARHRALALALVVTVAAGACGASAGPSPPPELWQKPMSATTCREWRNEMTDRQRDVAATALVGSDAALRLVFGIDDTSTRSRPWRPTRGTRRRSPTWLT
jgi:hypothetical protein